MNIVARIHNDYGSKFGIPRQSGIAPSLLSRIVFEPPYRNPDALRGIEGFSHLWLLWLASQAQDAEDTQGSQWTPTVRPPRLGGNKRMGVFATRSPFRPNNVCLSCVRLAGIEQSSSQGTMLCVAGADLMDGTPIIDIKPYLPYADCHPYATAGFIAEASPEQALTVDISPSLSSRLTQAQAQALVEALAADPRPRYHTDATRVYTMQYAGREVRFKVSGTQLTVISID